MAIDYTRRSGESTPSQAPVSLSKITLTKSAPTVNLAKAGERQGNMRVNLNWSQGAPPKKTGFLAKLAGAGSGAVDLDLGCLYELADGSKGVVQALGNSFGSLTSPPYISLDGDDRSGANTGGENMHVNLGDPSAFRRILIFAMIYDGAPNWAAVDGVVTLYPTNGPEVEVRLDSASNHGATVRDRAHPKFRSRRDGDARSAVHQRQSVRSRPCVQLGYEMGCRTKVGAADGASPIRMTMSESSTMSQVTG